MKHTQQCVDRKDSVDSVVGKKDFSVLSAKDFNSKSGNIWDRKLHDYMDGSIWLPDRQ